MTVLQLHKASANNDVVATLRRIADDIEGGNLEWPVTTAVLVVGHTDAEVPAGSSLMQSAYWTTYGMGPRCDTFTVRGLISSVLSHWNGGDA